LLEVGIRRRYANDGKPFHSRYTMVESSPTAYTYKWDMSEDGTKWTTVIEGKSTKKTE
jgi:hypothetical protein